MIDWDEVKRHKEEARIEEGRYPVREHIPEFSYSRLDKVKEIITLLEEQGYMVWTESAGRELEVILSIRDFEKISQQNHLLKTPVIGYMPHPNHPRSYDSSRVRTFILNNYDNEKPLFAYREDDDNDYHAEVEAEIRHIEEETSWIRAQMCSDPFLTRRY